MRQRLISFPAERGRIEARRLTEAAASLRTASGTLRRAVSGAGDAAGAKVLPALAVLADEKHLWLHAKDRIVALVKQRRCRSLQAGSIQGTIAGR